jgi:hypothetical protein
MDDDDSGSVTIENLHALRRQRDQERDARLNEEQRRIRAERERDEARGAAANEGQARISAEEASIEGLILAATEQADALTERIAQLNAEGSFAEAAKAHRALARAEAQVMQLNQKKENVANYRAWQEQQAQQARQQAPDPYAGFSSRQREWAQAHPLFMRTDAEGKRYTARVNAAHHAAVADDVPVDSEEYFRRLDEAGEGSAPRRQSNGNSNGDDGAAGRFEYDNGGAAPRRSQTPQMPVTRRSMEGESSRSAGPVRLSPEERESADITYPDTPVDDYVENGVTMPGRYRQYMFHKSRLKQEGRM